MVRQPRAQLEKKTSLCSCNKKTLQHTCNFFRTVDVDARFEVQLALPVHTKISYYIAYSASCWSIGEQRLNQQTLSCFLLAKPSPTLQTCSVPVIVSIMIIVIARALIVAAVGTWRRRPHSYMGLAVGAQHFSRFPFALRRRL